MYKINSFAHSSEGKLDIQTSRISDLIRNSFIRPLALTRYKHTAEERDNQLLENLFYRATVMMLHNNSKAADDVLPLYNCSGNSLS